MRPKLVRQLRPKLIYSYRVRRHPRTKDTTSCRGGWVVPGPRFGKFSETCLTYISALELFSLSIWTCGGRMPLNSTYRCSSIVKRLPIHDIDHRPPPVWTRRELRESNGPQMSGCHWPTGWVGGPESSERLSGMMSDTIFLDASCSR